MCWGGFKSSIDRDETQKFFHVRLWDADELLAVSDKLDADVRALIPLKRVRTLAAPDEHPKCRSRHQAHAKKTTAYKTFSQEHSNPVAGPGVGGETQAKGTTKSSSASARSLRCAAAPPISDSPSHRRP
jgi:hypothetical protein